MKDFSRFIQKALPESPPSALGIAQCQGGTQPPALGFCLSGAHYPMGQNIKEILPPSVPALEAQRKAPPGTGSHTNGTEPQCFGVWCLLGDTAPAQGHPGPAGKPPCLPPCWSLPKPSHHHPSHGGSGHQRSADRTAWPMPRFWERPCPGGATTTPGQVGSAGGARPALTSSSRTSW